MFLIRFSFFQNKISKEFTNYLSSEINSDIRLEEVSLNGFSNLQLNKIFIPDLNGDTVLFVPKVVVDIQDINWLDRKFIIDQVIFKDAEIVLRKNPGKKKYEIEKLNKTVCGQKMDLNIQNIIFLQQQAGQQILTKV